MKKPYRLHKRVKYWYFKLPHEKTYHSTDQVIKVRAEHYVQELLSKGDQVYPKCTLIDYASNFYLWNKCSWIKRQHAKGRPFSISQAKTRRGHLEKYLFPQFGNELLSELNPVDIENWLIILPLSNGTKNGIMYSLNIILKEAKREKLISANPLDDVEPLANEYRKRDVFTLEECKRLFPTDKNELLDIWHDPKWAAMHYLMLTSGIRCGEAGGLMWKHVVWDLGGILILQAVKADNHIGPTKNREKRSIILPGRTREMLDWWYNLTPFQDDEDFIFYGEGGKSHLNQKTIGRKVKPAMGQAGIDPASRWLSAHSLRTTYNTRMENVLTEALLRYQMGHKSRAMTERYTSKTPEERLIEMESSRKLIEGVWSVE